MIGKKPETGENGKEEGEGGHAKRGRRSKGAAPKTETTTPMPAPVMWATRRPTTQSTVRAAVQGGGTAAEVRQAMRAQVADMNIDRAHTTMITTYQSTADRLQCLRQDLRDARAQFDAAYSEQATGTNDSDSAREKLGALAAQIRALRREINQTVQVKPRLIDVARPVFRYYEDKQRVSTGTNHTNHQVLHSFFQLGTPGTNDTATDTPDNSAEIESRRLFQRYWMQVDGKVTYTKDFMVNTTMCSLCGAGELIPVEDEGILVCNNTQCGRIQTHIVDSQKTVHTEVPTEIYYTAYERMNHFKEILSPFQAKKAKPIPPEVLESIRARMTKERMTKADISYSQMRHILTVLELNKYFDHIHHINAHFGVPPPYMDVDLYNTMCVLFAEIQEPWAAECPPDRNNFFNYTYVLYQLFVLLDQTPFWKYTAVTADRVMKDRAKQMEQDDTWRKVCKRLDWVFNPTI